MKKVTVSFEIEIDEHTPIGIVDHLGQERLLKMLLCDAFGEFSTNRGPEPEAYVKRRYPEKDKDGNKITWPFTPREKIYEVACRRAAAEMIRNSVAYNLKTEMVSVSAASDKEK